MGAKCLSDLQPIHGGQDSKRVLVDILIVYRDVSEHLYSSAEIAIRLANIPVGHLLND